MQRSIAVFGVLCSILAIGAWSPADDNPAANATTRPQPADLGLSDTVVNLNFDGASLSHVLDDLSRQMGTDLGQGQPHDPRGEPEPVITLHLDHVSYWQAMAAIRDQAPSMGAFYMNTVGIPLEDQPGLIGNLGGNHWQTIGPFFVTSSQTNLYHFVNYGAVEEKGTHVNIWVQILSEPRIHVLDVTSQRWLRECRDEKGNLLPLFMDRSIARPIDYHSEGVIRPTFGYSLEAEVVAPPTVGNRIAKLAGQLELTVQTKSQRIEFDATPAAPKQTVSFGDNSVTFAKMTFQDDGDFRADLVLQGPIARKPPAAIQQILSQVRFFDAQGRFCKVWLGKIDGGQEKSYAVSLRSYPAPTTMRWDAPLEISPLVVPFELHDLALAH